MSLLQPLTEQGLAGKKQNSKKKSKKVIHRFFLFFAPFHNWFLYNTVN